ncbi:hypothetical protein SCHPADRAFT_946497 [Schizopora paradoxa]|uniref:Uncharacterized protein n=1 Tax=Schizopora paradoxa TaxID=27342 RepID=A0A0H2R2D9_9AGAM|nr:hypothetical protein SCHPADRAFT_946497 [Schizopora paradoxa]
MSRPQTGACVLQRNPGIGPSTGIRASVKRRSDTASSSASELCAPAVLRLPAVFAHVTVGSCASAVSMSSSPTDSREPTQMQFDPYTQDSPDPYAQDPPAPTVRYVSAEQAERLYLDLAGRVEMLGRRTVALREQLEAEAEERKRLARELLGMKSEFGDPRWRGLVVPFTGRQADVHSFVSAVEERFANSRSAFKDDHDKCLFALFCLQDAARVLRGELIRKDGLQSWKDFKRGLLLAVEECDREVEPGMSLLDLRYLCARAL